MQKVLKNKKLFLHIGTEKTGSTTIQETLFQNKEVLQNNGIHFVQSAGTKCNRDLVAYCMDDNKFDDFFIDRKINSIEEKKNLQNQILEKFCNEIESLDASIHTVIISSEHFHSRITTEDEIKKIFQLLSPYFLEINIICYVREQSATCLSRYSTGLKTGTTVNINTYLKECTPNNLYYNYFDLLTIWSKVFEKKNIIVRLFEKSAFKNGNLLEDFFSIISPILFNCLQKKVENQNESLNLLGQYLGRVTNTILPRYTKEDSINKARNKAIACIYRDFRGESSRAFQISQDDFDKIYFSFEESNKKLNANFLEGEISQNCFTYKEINLHDSAVVLAEHDMTKIVNFIKTFCEISTAQKFSREPQSIEEGIQKRQKIVSSMKKIPLSPQHLSGAILVESRLTMLDNLPKEMRVCELGVAQGEFSKELYARLSPNHLTLVDLWEGERYGAYQTVVEDKFKNEILNNEVSIKKSLSVDFLKTCSENSYDFIYIDTNHTYQTTLNELREAARIISPNGFIAGHDYTVGNIVRPVVYGVIQAVSQFCVEYNFKFHMLTVEPHGYNSFCLVKI